MLVSGSLIYDKVDLDLEVWLDMILTFHIRNKSYQNKIRSQKS